jgi:hypothetical protein
MLLYLTVGRLPITSRSISVDVVEIEPYFMDGLKKGKRLESSSKSYCPL